MTENTVPMSVYEQTAWERDLALMQLKEIGKGLGERMDDIERVVRCAECRHYVYVCNLRQDGYLPDGVTEAVCSHGERKNNG